MPYFASEADAELARLIGNWKIEAGPIIDGYDDINIDWFYVTTANLIAKARVVCPDHPLHSALELASPDLIDNPPSYGRRVQLIDRAMADVNAALYAIQDRQSLKKGKRVSRHWPYHSPMFV